MNVWVTVLAALGPASLVGTLVNAYVQRRKLRAETTKTGIDAVAVLTETATELIAPLRQELALTRDDLSQTRQRLTETQREISALRTHLGVVEGLLRANGIPVPEFVWPHSNGKRGP